LVIQQASWMLAWRRAGWRLEGLVGIADHVFTFVLATRRRRELKQLFVEDIVGRWGALAFRYVGALRGQELLPQTLCVGLLTVQSIALVAMPLYRACIKVGPLGGVDAGVVIEQLSEGLDELVVEGERPPLLNELLESRTVAPD
jgi:hypothetical protein